METHVMAFRMEQLTVKAQEAVQRSQSLAEQKNHQQLQPLHLLKALLDEPEGVIAPLMKKIGINQQQLNEMVDGELGRIPSVSGEGVQVAPTKEFMSTLEKAATIAEQMQDQFVSTEHLLLSLVDVDGQPQRLLAMNGVKKDDILTALQAVRGGHSVTDQNPEEKYQ